MLFDYIDLPGYCFSSERMVSSHHKDLQSCFLAGIYGLKHPFFRRVHHGDDSDEGETCGREVVLLKRITTLFIISAINHGEPEYSLSLLSELLVVFIVLRLKSFVNRLDLPVFKVVWAHLQYYFRGSLDDLQLFAPVLMDTGLPFVLRVERNFKDLVVLVSIGISIFYALAEPEQGRLWRIPYDSEIGCGFRMRPGQNRVSV